MAVTEVLASSVNMQTGLLLPGQAPDQPVKAAFALGTAVSVMGVPGLKLVPGPTALVESETCGPLNVAVAVVFALRVTIHSVGG